MEYMPKIAYGEVNDEVLQALRPPRRSYYVVVLVLLAGMSVAGVFWMYQVRMGMGVAGLSIPVGWAVYIANFVFWVGIAHSGTLISAILHLVRAQWRAAVSRSAEAMTIFAILTAGLFPLIHLGRLWVVYYVIPYPSERQIWPNFVSPIVWDVLAVTTYLIVSLVFWYVGMIPDLAATRDRLEQENGPGNLRARFYRTLALGWSGAASQWHHYGRGYLYFAALATPLVVSVHSVVSWDFAMGLLPGWHTTIFAPYFVAGAIHSGLAMVILLVMPMSYLLGLRKVITVKHFEAVAITMLVTTGVIAYAYLVEPFMAWYSGDRFEQQFALWRATGQMAWVYWSLWPLNVIFPLLFISKKIRTSKVALYLISLGVVAGMWLERFLIVPSATSHDFLPNNWHAYAPRWIEIGITIGAFSFFMFFFLIFTKVFPTVPVSDIKELLVKATRKHMRFCGRPRKITPVRDARPAVMAIYGDEERLLEAAGKMCDGGYTLVDAFSPVRIEALGSVMGLKPSPTRYWTLIGSICGCAGGFWLAAGTALVNNLIVGGKPPLSWIPFCIPGFEGTVLLGVLFGLVGLIYHARLATTKEMPCYDRRFSRDKFGLLVAADRDKLSTLQQAISQTGPEETRVFH